MQCQGNSPEDDGVEVPIRHSKYISIEDRYRKAHDQLELFPAPTRRHISWKVVAILIAASVLFLLFVSHIKAAEPFHMTSGLICDTKEQLTEQLDNVSKGDQAVVAGCGMVSQPMDALATPVGEYHGKDIDGVITQYETKELGIQFGLSHVSDKPPGITA